MSIRRDISGQSFSMLAKLPFAQGPEYVTSIVKAMLVSPEGYTKDGVSKLFTGTDLATITGKAKPKVLQAMKMLQQANDFATMANLVGEARSRLIGEFEVNYVMFIHGKKVRSPERRIETIT